MFRNKDYRRPNQNWVCGRACDGNPCERGPDPDGTCHSEHGCIPERSLRAKRGLVALLVTAASVGIILAAFGLKAGSNHLFSPGPLSSNHASIKDDCSACHVQAGNILTAKWIFAGRDPHANSQKCLECHQLGDHAFSAHGLSGEAMTGVQENLRAQGFSIIPNPSGAEGMRKMECASCHVEHHGANADLKAMTNHQCQTCHSLHPSDFSNDHAEFRGNYPFDRRTRILFDHASHLSKHFQDGNVRDTACNSCHTPDHTGEFMVLKGFERNCVTCHDAAIRGTDMPKKGVVVFRLPTIDIKSLIAAGASIGEWPEDADGKLTGFQMLLLAADPDIKDDPAILNVLAELPLDDLSEASPAEIASVVRIVWSLKAMLAGMSEEGAAFFKPRLAAVLEHEPTDAELSRLLGNIPRSTVREALRSWLPNLVAELKSRAENLTPATRGIMIAASSEDADDEAWMAAGGWYHSTSDFSIKYRPTGHADLFIKNWIELAASRSDSASRNIFNQLTSSSAPGACMKCHSVDQTGGDQGSMRVNWVGRAKVAEPKHFSRFRHSSHFSLLTDKGCYTCHALNPTANYAKAYEGRDPAIYESNFLSIKKATCVTCHKQDAVLEKCESCHNYHAEQPVNSYFKAFLN